MTLFSCVVKMKTSLRILFPFNDGPIINIDPFYVVTHYDLSLNYVPKDKLADLVYISDSVLQTELRKIPSNYY